MERRADSAMTLTFIVQQLPRRGNNCFNDVKSSRQTYSRVTVSRLKRKSAKMLNLIRNVTAECTTMEQRLKRQWCGGHVGV